MKIQKRLITAILSAIMILQCAPVYAAAASTTLTVEKAASKAISYSSKIKALEDSNTLSDENRKKAMDALNDAIGTSSVLTAYTSLMSVEMGIALNLEDITAQKENVEYQITKYFNAIINAEKTVELYDKNLALAKKELDILALKVTLGLASQVDYETSKLAYEKNLKTRETYVSSINSAYRDLNSYMGTDLDTKYDLELDLVYEEVGTVNITSYVDTFIKKSTTVKQAENNVTIAKYKYDNFVEPYNSLTGEITDTTSIDSYEIAYSQASRTLSNTKQSVKEAVISTYNSLKDAEISIATQELDIQDSFRQLEIAKVKLDLGQATQLEIDTMQYQIDSKEETLRKDKNTYILSVMAFRNPNILISSSSSAEN